MIVNITGVFYLPSGVVAADRVVAFKPIDRTVRAGYLGGLVPDPVIVQTGIDGSVDFNLLTGSYFVTIEAKDTDNIGRGLIFAGKANVPDVPSASISEILDAAVAPDEPPVWYTQAIQAAEDAIDAAERAEGAAPFPSYAAALAAPKPAGQNLISALVDGRLVEWVRQASGPCLGGGWAPAGEVTAEHFDQTNVAAAINAALAYANAKKRPEVLLTRQNYQVTEPIIFPAGSQNLVLKGGGAAPLASSASATIITYVGPEDDDIAVIDIVGRSTGSAVQGVYVDCGFKAGDGIRLQSVYASEFSDAMVLNYRKRGWVLTIHPAASNDSWYTSKNTFQRCSANSSHPGSRAWNLIGVRTPTRRNGVWGNTFINCDGNASRTLDKALMPAALYLGYCDSNQFIKCDFTLTISGLLPEDRFALNLNGMVSRNGADEPDGQIWRVRDGITPVAQSHSGPRWGVIYRFDKSSTAAADGKYVLAPTDGVGRFLRYNGAGIVIDGNMENQFPVNNTFTNCTLARYEPVVDVTSNGNTPGAALEPYNSPSLNFWPYPTLDYADIPHHIPHVAGVTDTGTAFGNRGWEVRGKPLLLTDATNMRRTRITQNSVPGSENYGLIFVIEERTSDGGPWTEISRYQIARNGDLLPGGNATQDLGSTTKRFAEAHVNRVLLGNGAVIRDGTGNPEGAVTANPGTIYIATSGASAELYFKASGTGNTGWVAK